MNNKTQYTKNEIQELCQAVAGITNSLYTHSVKSLNNILDALVHNPRNGYTVDNDQVIFKVRLSQEETNKFKNQEQHGEHCLFLINQECTYLEFWVRHLNQFLFNTQIDDSIMLMNTPILTIFSKWRLQIGR